MESTKDIRNKTDNELIAEFMGLERSKEVWDNGEHAYTMKLSEVFNKWVIPSKMKFHTSWDWLMPAVQKAAKITMQMECKSKKQFSQLVKYWNVVTIGLVKPDLQATYKGVIQFIQWYNKNNS